MFESACWNRRTLLARVLSIMILAGTAGCRESDVLPPPSAVLIENASTEASASSVTAIRFQTLPPDAGLDFTYRNGEEAGHFAILESLGGGVAVADFDRDGVQDIVFPGGGGYGEGEQIQGAAPGLFRQIRTLRFANVTAHAGLEHAPHYSHGAAAADFDNDGFPDLLVTGYGGLLLFRNAGDGTFEEVAGPAGLDDALWSTSAAWGDLNRDGVLDLYVGHYVNWSFANHPRCDGPMPEARDVCPPRNFEGLSDICYLANGDGTFRDASAEVGLESGGKGLGVVIADVDLNGHVDVYVGNDTVPNFLYQNDGNGRLVETGLASGSSVNERGTPDGSMGVDIADYNQDGLPDIWVANYERESFALYRNESGGFFRHVSQPTGITATRGLFVGWGTAFFDADRDGDEDILASNGHVIRYPVAAPLRQTPLFFENLQGERFVNVAPAAGDYFVAPHMGRGLAIGDLDDDGDIDAAFSHSNEPVAVVLNESPPRHWLGIRLISTSSPRTPIGAVVQLVDASGRAQMRQVKGGGSYASTSDSRLHWGLGDAETVATVSIRWPSGVEQTVVPDRIDAYIEVIEPATK